MNATDSSITRLLRGVTALEVGVLIGAGGGLFLLPGVVGPIWPWSLAPFDTRFLGAVYAASCVAAALLVIAGTWSPARIVVPMIFVFTAIVLVLSVVYLARFTGPLTSTVAWFVLYVGIPVNALHHMIIYRRRPVAAGPPGAGVATLLRVQVAILGGYGLALLVLPGVFGSFWPWPLDDFHARLYSTAFLTPAVGAWLLLRAAPAADLRALGLTQLAGGVLPVAGLLIVHRATGRVDWTEWGTWAWLGLFAGILAVGSTLLRESRQSSQKPPNQKVASDRADSGLVTE